MRGRDELLSIFTAAAAAAAADVVVFVFRAQLQSSPPLRSPSIPPSLPPSLYSAIDVVSVRTRLTSENSAHLALEKTERKREIGRDSERSCRRQKVRNVNGQRHVKIISG